MELFSTWLNSYLVFLTWPIHFINWLIKTPSGSGLIPRRKPGVISRLPSHKPLFCTVTGCEMSLPSNATLLTQGSEPLCLSFSSQWVSNPEPLLKLRPGTFLAIVFVCEKFDKYIFRRDVVHVDTDHKPLEEIFKKSLCDAPARLQRMLLWLQRYNLEVKYQKVSLMFATYTLSHGYLRKMLPSEEVKSLELVDHAENLQVSPYWLTRIEQESALDPVCADLQQVILEGWPGNIHECDLVLHPFFPVLWCADCSREPGFPQTLPVCPQYPQKRVYVPSSLESHWPGGCLPPTSRVHVLVRNEHPNEGLRGSVWHLPYTSRLASSGTIISAWSSASSLGQGCCGHLFSLRPNSAGCCQLFQ